MRDDDSSRSIRYFCISFCSVSIAYRSTVMNFVSVTVVAALCVVVAAGCADETTSALSGAASDATGIRVTSPAGPLQVAVWGNPTTPDYAGIDGPRPPGVGLPRPEGEITNPFPNPTTSGVTLSFPMGRSGSVRVWVEEVRFAGWLASTHTSVAGATLRSSSGRYVATVIDARLEAGTHSFTWALPADRRTVPAGVYRIYVSTENLLRWRDMIIYHSLADLPADLRAIVAQW